MRDICKWLSLVRNKKPANIIVLLTPFPTQARNGMENGFDPFECFGQALASHNCKIRHVPYTNQDGIVSTHAYFIKRAAAVIFVMSETNCGPQVEAAFTTKALTDGGPLMVVMWNMHLIPTLRDFDNIIIIR